MSIAHRLDPYTPEPDPEYDMQRLIWRSKLSDTDCRSIAYDYRVAQAAYEKHGGEAPDECLADAWEEYQARFGGSPRVEFLNTDFSMTKRRRMYEERTGRSSINPISPLYNERGMLQ